MSSYRSVARHRPWRRFFLAAVLSRLPITMGVFGLVLAGHALGSFALGARLAALYTITGAALSVRRGRRMDRGDLRRGLQRDGLVVAVLAAGIALCVHTRAPDLLAACFAVALGGALAAIPGGYRAMVGSVVPEEDRPAAFALDAVCVEACFVAGPAVAAVVAWFAGPAGVFVLMAVCALGGAVATSRLPSVVHPVPVAGAGPRAPHRVPAMIGVLVGAAGAGMGLGVLDATFPAFAVRLGTRAAVGGLFVTLMALGSGTAGVVFGPKIAAGRSVGRTAVLLLLLFGIVVLPLAAAPSVAVVIGLAFVAGAPFALMTTSASVMIQRSVDPSRTTEAFSLMNAGLLTGDAAGNALASALIGGAGARVTLLLASAGPVVAAVLLAVMATRARRRGRPAAPGLAAPGARPGRVRAGAAGLSPALRRLLPLHLATGCVEAGVAHARSTPPPSAGPPHRVALPSVVVIVPDLYTCNSHAHTPIARWGPYLFFPGASFDMLRRWRTSAGRCFDRFRCRRGAEPALLLGLVALLRPVLVLLGRRHRPAPGLPYRVCIRGRDRARFVHL